MHYLHSDIVYLTHFNLSILISALQENRESVTISTDLNLTRVTIPIVDRKIEIGGSSFDLKELTLISKNLNGITLLKNGELENIEFFANGYFKLRPTEFAPTLEIDGIRMHRTKDIDPWEDSRRKVAYVVKPGDYVLDTCGGLGYTALWAVQFEARKVISVEKNPAVIRIRELNPHSYGLKNERIETLKDDIYKKIADFDDIIFDSIIHDPPKFSLAGELYGFEFYSQLFRVLKPGGRIFHYVGDPYSKGRGRLFLEGIEKRMKKAEFIVKQVPEDLGIIAWKK